jgi:hypothetical protein
MPDRLGDKIGPRLADLIGRHVLAARRDHAPIEAKIRQAATQALIDKAGHEFADHIGPIIAEAIAANPDMDKGVKDYLLRTASGKHQLQAIAGHLALAGAGSVLGTLLSNELAPFAYAVVSSNPHLRLDPQTAATLWATGLLDGAGLHNEAAASGLDSERAQLIGQAAQAVPDSATLGDLVNRQLLSVQDANYWIQRGGYGQTLHGPLLAARKTLLSPADAALAVTRSIFTESEGAARAALSGVDGADFATLVANTGEPLGLEQLLEALRRGFIDGARFDRGFRQARYRNEWVDVALKLQYSPMSAADAIEALVQGHIAETVAREKAAQNGLEPSDFDALYQTAGEPLSRTELEQLLNRGEVTTAFVEQGLRESRLKNKYVPDAVKLHVRLPEGRQIVSMVTHGVVDKPAALKLLMQVGYSQEVAGYLVAEGTSAKIGTHKTLTISEIHSLYVDGVFTAAHAEQLLAGMGFDAADAGYLIRAWDLVAAAAVTRQAINVVRAKYVARHFDHQAAVLYLDSLNIAPAARDRYLTLWDIERGASVAVLSEAQIVHAHKTGLISGQDAYTRLTQRGYDPGDARILLGVAPGAEIPA